ncbi:hypothetical protein ACG33_11360 [Steroidobacter denitrificans]|uniref:Uncharacterized protein n=1 Tax=Steroidobacter denitrificans TaxID=465721 RepID=A0A127FBA4_STEDE|nr:hypothetical protein [Steroidobacter denitrificans]AMN47686.1 hypothetical protein ACG33_11360 [Steroidobacter denitrificans]
MQDWELKKLAQYGKAPAWSPLDQNRPNEDRPVVLRPAKDMSQFYANVFHNKPVDPSRWHQEKLTWRVLPAEQKHRAAGRRGALEVGLFRTLLVEVYGDQGYQIIDAVYSSFAEDDYRKARKKGLIPEPDKCGPIEAANFICTIYDVEYLQPFVIAEATNERVRLQGYFESGGGCDLCHYGVRKGDHRLCEMTGGWERAIVKLMNPKLRSRVTKTRAVGDFSCEVCIEWEDDDDFSQKDPAVRPPLVRPKLEQSEVYKKIMLDMPVDPSSWTKRVAPKVMHWEAKHISCTRKFSAEAGALRTMIAELYGDEGYDLIEKAYGSLAESEYQLGRRRGHIKTPSEMGPIEAARYICFMYDVNGRAPLTFPEISADRVVIQHSLGIPATCNYCARQGDWRMCNVETAFERNLVKLMNPELRARRTKGKIYGDYGCELVVEWDR